MRRHFKRPKQTTVVQEQAAELERGISHTQASLASFYERQHQLQSQRNDLKQRFSNSTAVLDAMLSVSSLLPDTPVVPDPPDQGGL